MPETVEITLESRPELVNLGLAEHGLHGSEAYALPRLWALHLYFYTVELEVGATTCSIVPGTLTLIPPGQRMLYHYPAHRRHRHFFVLFRLPKKGPKVAVPLCQHLPEARDEILDRLEHLREVHQRNRSHAEILFWALLWDLAEAGRSARQPPPPLAGVIDAWIDERLPGPLTVAEIARHAGCSARHVNRTIKAAHGVTAVQWLRKRRLQQAYTLLIHSTMPIRRIARECGIEDLHRFNKLMRAEYGQSPRALRERRQEREGTPWVSDRI